MVLKDLISSGCGSSEVKLSDLPQGKIPTDEEKRMIISDIKGLENELQEKFIKGTIDIHELMSAKATLSAIMGVKLYPQHITLFTDNRKQSS